MQHCFTLLATLQLSWRKSNARVELANGGALDPEDWYARGLLAIDRMRNWLVLCWMAVATYYTIGYLYGVQSSLLGCTGLHGFCQGSTDSKRAIGAGYPAFLPKVSGSNIAFWRAIRAGISAALTGLL